VEAEQLERFSHGLRGVRAVVTRETIGVDHPVRQLGALDQTTVAYQRAIGQLDRRLQDPAVPTASVQDWLALISSLVELIYTAYYWLQVARIVRRLPSYPPGRTLLSTERSRQRRSDAVAEIAIARSRAIDLMGRLIRVLQAQDPDAARVLTTLFQNTTIQIRCAETLALVAADSAPVGSFPVPRDIFEEEMQWLDDLVASPLFEKFSDSMKELVWLSVSKLASSLGDETKMREAVRHCLASSAGDLDFHIHMLVNALKIARSDDERLELTKDLHAVGRDPSLGRVFSRERLGRTSILSGVFSQVAGSAMTGTADGARLIDESYASQHRWLYDKEAVSDARVIKLVANWEGDGRVSWHRPDGSTVVRAFALDPVLAANLVRVTESPSTSPKPITAAINALSAEIGPIVAEALGDIAEARLEIAGFLSLLPVMATSVNSVPAGFNPQTAYLHPLTGSLSPSVAPVPPPDLLIIDRAFRASQQVDTAFRLLHQTLGTVPTIVAFDSGPSGDDVEPEAVLGSMSTARGAMFYGHARNPIATAQATALVLRPHRVLQIERLADTDLRNLETLVLIACSSGRQNPFLGPVSVSDAMAFAGVRNVVFSLWPITAAVGARFVNELLSLFETGRTAGECLAALFGSSPALAAPFGSMRV
jgi:hypothetical protein